MNRLIFPLIVFVFVALIPSAVSAQAADPAGVSVSSAYVPDLSMFPKPKERNKKQASKAQSATVPSSPEDRPVWLPLTVLNERWDAVADIRPREIEILINGEKQDILEFEFNSDESETVFVVDMSPSSAVNVDDIQFFLETVIAKLPTSQRVTIWKFDAKPQILVEGSIDRAAIKKAIGKLEMNGGTSLYDTIDRLCRDKKQDSYRPRAVFFISDGVDTTSKDANGSSSLLRTNACNDVYFPIYLDTYQYHADRLKNSPRPITNIPGINSVLNAQQPIRKEDFDLGRQYLTMLLKMSGGRAFIFPTSKAEIETVATNVAATAQRSYAIRVKTGPRKPAMTVQVSVRRPNLKVLTKSVFEAAK